MPLRFRRSIKLGPGLKFNINKKSMGFSVGVRGAHYTVNTRGQRTTSVGLPGTGLWYTERSRTGAPARHARSAEPVGRSSPATPPLPSALPKPGWFARSFEKQFYAGVKAYLARDVAGAYAQFNAASRTKGGILSADLFAGVAANELGNQEQAIAHLEKVAASETGLPDRLMAKYLPHDAVDATVQIRVTPAVTVTVPMSTFSACLMLAEVYQRAGRTPEAIGLLQQMIPEAPQDLALTLALCDLLYEDGDDDGVVETASNTTADSEVGFACQQLKAAALARQGMHEAALETLSACLHGKALDQYPELAKGIRYDRAVVYASLGRSGLAHRDFEHVYAADPSFEDVRAKLGVTPSPHTAPTASPETRLNVPAATAPPGLVQHCPSCGTNRRTSTDTYCASCGAKW